MKTLKILLISVVMFGMFSSVAVAQDLEVFKTRMAEAAEMTKKDMSEALLKYLEIRADFAGPEVDYSLGRVYQRLTAYSSLHIKTYLYPNNDHPVLSIIFYWIITIDTIHNTRHNSQ